MQRLKLNIGCGLIAPSGWVSIDSSLNASLAKCPGLRKTLAMLNIIPLSKANIPYPKNILVYDIRRGLFFPDNSIEIIYSSHFLEHLTRRDALFFMKECYRVLTVGGIIRIITPDLAQYTKQYIQGLSQIRREASIEALPAEKFLRDLGVFENEDRNKNIFLRFYKIIYDKNIHKWLYDEYSLASLLKNNGFSNIERKTPYESLIEDIEDVEKLEDPARFDNAVCLEAQKL